MTDETFERIEDFVKRNAVPATEYLPGGLPVEIIVDATLPDDEPYFAEHPYIYLRVSPEDFNDLQLRMKMADREEEVPPV